MMKHMIQKKPKKEVRGVKRVQEPKDEIEVCLPASQLAEMMKLSPESVSSMRLSKITEEFAKGFHFLRTYGKAVTFFGSSRFSPDHEMYQEAERLAYMLSKEDFAVITGGGPGIMEAANKGALDAEGRSAGINIELPSGQRANKYVNDSASFHYFFARKVMLAFASEAYIFFPGGFGTLDEFFELTTLVQTKKIEEIPVVLVGNSYWQPLLNWIEKTVYRENKAIEKDHMEIYHLVPDAEQAFEYIKSMVKVPEGIS